MKKVSTFSYIIAIVLVMCSIACNFIGFRYIDGTRIIRQASRGFMQMTYYTTTTPSNFGLGMIITGGFLFVGAMVLFMLSVLAASKCSEECCKEQPCPKKECPKKAHAAQIECDAQEKAEPAAPEAPEASASDAATPGESE